MKIAFVGIFSLRDSAIRVLLVFERAIMSLLPEKPGDRLARMELRFFGPDGDNPTAKLLTIPSLELSHLQIVDARRGIVRVEGHGEFKNVLRVRLYELVGVQLRLLGFPTGTGNERENIGKWVYVMGTYNSVQEYVDSHECTPAVRSALLESNLLGVIDVDGTRHALCPGEEFIGRR
jgi:hypothetical protein